MRASRVSSWIELDAGRLECAWVGPPPAEAPTLVMLHEGLGSVSLWGDFPEALVDATGCGALVYSRYGYGRSDPCALPRPLTYMQEEGIGVLPRVLERFGVREPILVGHSDGASIAIACAGGAAPRGLLAIVLEAPHVFCEDVSVRSIAKARDAFEAGDLRERLQRHHGENVDCAFWGWNRAWLDPAFRAWSLEPLLPTVRVPALVVQGEDDEYGTLAQLDAIRARAGATVETVVLPSCGHAPHRTKRTETLDAIAAFVARVVRERAGA